MRKRDLRNWAAASSVAGSPDNEDSGAEDDGASSFGSSPEDLEELTQDWDAFMLLAENKVLSGSTSVRRSWLGQALGPFVRRTALEASHFLPLLSLLTLTYARYTDTDSRDAVLIVIRELVQQEQSRLAAASQEVGKELNPQEGVVLKKLIGWAEGEAEKICGGASGFSSAPSNRYSLLVWSSTLFSLFGRTYLPDSTALAASSPSFPAIVRTLSVLFDSLLNDASEKDLAQQRKGKNLTGGAGKKKQKNAEVPKSGLVHLRRALRENHALIPALVEFLAAGKSSSTRNAGLLGVAIDVSLRLRVGKEKVKGEEGGVGRGYVAAVKPAILNYLNTAIISSKSPLPAYAIRSFHDFIETHVSLEDVRQTLLPQMERMLLRSPEVSLPMVTEFFAAYPGDVSPFFRQLLPSLMSSSRSSNATTRARAVGLYEALLPKMSSDDAAATLRAALVNDLLAVPKTGKSQSPEHRAALFSMAALTPPTLLGVEGATDVLGTLGPLIGKESNDVAMAALMDAFSAHCAWLLRNGGSEEDAKKWGATVAKDMAHTKVGIRRAVVAAVGRVVWGAPSASLSMSTVVEAPGDSAPDASEELVSPALVSFARAVLPGLEANLKNASSNPLNNPAGPLEGYVAVALAEGRLQKFGDSTIRSTLSKNAVLSAILTAAPKPSFLLWDKVYRKLTSAEEEVWFLHALEAVALADSASSTIDADTAVRTAVGTALVHLAAETSNLETMLETARCVEQCNRRAPRRVNRLVVEGLRSFYASKAAAGAASATATRPSSGGGEEEVVKPKSYERAISHLLASASTFSPSTSDDSFRQDALVALLVVGHHPLVCGRDRQTWIELCQRASVDPHALAESRLVDLMAEVRQNAESEVMGEAAFQALTTLAFVAPETVLPEVVRSLETSFDMTDVDKLTSEDLAIWKTPEGTLFHDVLAAKKDKQVDKNRKNYKIEQWEEELRQSIAKKKAATQPRNLTKEEKALVDAQVKKEAAMRDNVRAIQRRLTIALRTLRALVDARSEAFERFVTPLLDHVLHVLSSASGTALVGKDAADTVLRVATIADDRLGPFRTSLCVAMLRAINADVVEEEYRAEDFGHLVTRILYRFRFLAEQSPFSVGIVALCMPLINRIISEGGLGVDKGDAESTLEQIQLALDFISFNVLAAQDPRYPRVDFIKDFLQIVARHTQLAKDAVGALLSLSEAIKGNAAPQELELLLSSILAEEVYVRSACLQALQPLDFTDYDFSAELFLSIHDEDEQNARLAETAWEENALDVPEDFVEHLLPLLEHPLSYVRVAASKALATAVRMYPGTSASLVEALQDLYRERAKLLLPEYDQFGMVIESTLNRQDPWEIRVAVALTLKNLAELITPDDVVPLFRFYIEGEALGDRNEDVRQRMLDAASAAVDVHGKECLSGLISMFETYFTHSTPATDTSDRITEAVVILFGRVARHLEASDKRITQVIDRLMEALKTPSEVVQAAVADCLPPLIRAVGDEASPLFRRLLKDLLHAQKYAERRGAAYGLAGLISGRGINAIKEFDLMSKLEDAVEDKKEPKSRQGALFAYETLSSTLGRLFEPYVIGILPQLLACFGDASADVREAAQDTARVIMQSISGHCVKLILPSLLSGLDDKQWRSKKGAIELLGTMAYCAPRQLSISLPTIIPRLSEVLTDSHTQVRTAANRSLKQFGEVISNPEIRDMVPVLLQALIDPNTKTAVALNSLLETSFVHYIDSPSLALVVPILDRGLKERSADIKKRAVQIVGNLSSLTDSKDFIPYLDRLMPQVRIVLVDPVPEARATAAKALGTLLERLGEINFPSLVPDLLQVLRSDTGGVDRQGAAQGLAEVLAGLGMDRLEGLLPDIISSATSARSYVREGYISLLIYLPATFGHRFAPHLGRIIPPILGGLSDESDHVREASMRAGRMIVANYSTKAIDLLLPELESGMFDENWRIRYSSIQLVADLLFRISGISGKNELEEEDEDADEVGTGNETARKALVEKLGTERRDRILASIYILRQEPNIPVRQAAIHTWKALVHNTPRTVREILPTMLDIIVRLLASFGDEKQEMSAATLGELCRKLGERILREAVPLLRERISTAAEAKTRQGVCFALSEVMANATKAQLEDHEDGIIAAVRTALIDESKAVRAAAAQAFDAMQQFIGPKAIDQTIPTLLESLSRGDDSSQTALEALKEVMRARANVVFPVLIPTLIAHPITASRARALGALVQVAGSALNQRLSNILSALSKAVEEEKDEEVRAEVQEAIRALLASVQDYEAVHTLMLMLLGWANNESPSKRVAGCNLITIFCTEKGQADMTDYVVDWVRQLVSLLDDRDEKVVDAAWNALDALIKTVSKQEMEGLVVPLRRTVESTGMRGRDLPGFCRPKGIAPIVPVFLQGLMNGTAEQREQAALGLGDVVERTSQDAVKPFVTTMVGPLIRACGDRHTPPVKTAILSTLAVMLVRIPNFVRPFFPQLQRTFVKAVADPASNSIRLRAGVALGELMKLQPRVDPVIAELIAGARGSDGIANLSTSNAGAVSTMGSSGAVEIEIAESMTNALARVLEGAPSKNIGPASREAIVAFVEEAFVDSTKESYRKAAAEILGAFASHDPEAVRGIIETRVIPGYGDGQLASMSALSLVEKSSQALFDLGLEMKLANAIRGFLKNEAPAVARPARDARDVIKTTSPWAENDKIREMF